MYDGWWHDLITLLAGRRKGLEATMKKTPFLHQLRGHLGFLEVFEMVKSYQEIPVKTRLTTTVAPSVMRKCRRRTVTKNELHLFRNSMRKCWLPYIGKWNNSSGKTKVLWLDDHVKVVQPFFLLLWEWLWSIKDRKLFNPNWHELWKREKCSSLGPSRGKFL